MKNIKNILSIVLLAILSFTATTAQESDSSLLWKIEGDNIQTSYVFGTVHMISKDEFILKESVKKAFAATELLVLELDMDDPGMQSEMMKYVSLPEGEQLKNHMDEKEYEILDTYFQKSMGVGMAQFDKMKPFMVSTMVMMGHLGTNMTSYEANFVTLAQEQQKEIKGLETVAFQMGIFDNQSYEQQIDDIIQLLDEDGSMKTFFDNLTEVYLSEDIEAIHSSLNEYFSYDKAFEKAILDDRNEDWIPKIGNYSKDQTVFYGVGSGHLGGKNGVISLLKEAGYKVTPVLD